MKDKIYKNREVLRGLSILTTLAGGFYKFKILYVNDRGIKISMPMPFEDLDSAIGPIESIVKKVIVENSTNKDVSLSRKAYLSRPKLKRIPIVVDNVKFKLDNITGSKLTLDKLIGYDELEECGDEGFLSIIRRNVSRNLLKYPPEVKKEKDYGYYGYSTITPYLFDSFDPGMNFQEWNPRRESLSEAEIERSRKKYKKANKEFWRRLDMMQRFETDANTLPSTRELARFR